MIKTLINKVCNRETISYLVFGVLTTIVCLVSYEAIKLLLTGGGELSQLQMNIVNVGSWIIAVAFAFVTNKFFVFQSKSVEINAFKGNTLLCRGKNSLFLYFEIVWMNVTVGLFI